MKQFFRLTALVAFTCALSACNSSPSNDEAKTAVQDHFKQFAGKISFFSFEEKSCEKQSDGKTYTCLITMDATLPFIGREKSTQKFTFTKDDDGKWVVLED